jgi:ribonuclease HI
MAKEKEKAYTPNVGLGLEKFDYINWKNWTPELWAEYQAIMQGLEKRKMYDFTEYKAVGIFKKVHDEINDVMVNTNILIGIELVEATPLKHTRVESQFIEDWAKDRQDRWRMVRGLNAQIYDKANPRTNSRFYFLTQPKESEANNA